MIDTHCHLTFDDYAGRVDEVLAAARAQGVSACISISTTTADCHDALAVAKAHPEMVRCSSGVHPLYADREPHDWDAIRAVAEDPLCVAWGELGLDRHYDNPPLDLQRRVLADQLRHIESWRDDSEKLAAMPVVIHCREAFDDLIPILAASSIPADRFVFHCFTAGPREMRMVMDFGAMVSFTGVLTYKNAAEVREAAAIVPLDRVMVETDAPFLSPEPHRGVRPNEPRLVTHVARCLAERVHEMSFEDLERQLDENARRFFPNMPEVAVAHPPR